MAMKALRWNAGRFESMAKFGLTEPRPVVVAVDEEPLALQCVADVLNAPEVFMRTVVLEPRLFKTGDGERLYVYAEGPMPPNIVERLTRHLDPMRRRRVAETLKAAARVVRRRAVEEGSNLLAGDAYRSTLTQFLVEQALVEAGDG